MLIKFISKIMKCYKKDKALTQKQLNIAKRILLQQMLDERDINWNIFNKYNNLYDFIYDKGIFNNYNMNINHENNSIYLIKIQKNEIDYNFNNRS